MICLTLFSILPTTKLALNWTLIYSFKSFVDLSKGVSSGDALYRMQVPPSEEKRYCFDQNIIGFSEQVKVLSNRRPTFEIVYRFTAENKLMR